MSTAPHCCAARRTSPCLTSSSQSCTTSECLASHAITSWARLPSSRWSVATAFASCCAKSRRRSAPTRNQGGTWDAFFWVRDVRALHDELKGRGAVIVYGPIVQKAYDMEEFAVRDRDGYVLGFGQPLA